MAGTSLIAQLAKKANVKRALQHGGNPIDETPQMREPLSTRTLDEENMNLAVQDTVQDYPDAVIARHAEIEKEAPAALPKGDIDEQLDRVAVDMIENGEINLQAFENTSKASTFRKTPTSDPEAQAIANYVDPNSFTHFQELENLDRFMKGELPEPAVKKQPMKLKGKSGTTGEPINTVRRSNNDMDLLNERRDAQLAELEAQIYGTEVSNPKNRAILADDVINADIADDAIRRAEGPGDRRKVKFEEPGVAGEFDNFSIREIKDMLKKKDKNGNPVFKDPNARAEMEAMIKESGEAIRTSGRSSPNKKGPTLPKTKQSFDNRPRPKPHAMANTLEKLHGPLRGKNSPPAGKESPQLAADRHMAEEAGTERIATVFDDNGKPIGKEVVDTGSASPDANVRLQDDVGPSTRPLQQLIQQRMSDAKQGPSTNRALGDVKSQLPNGKKFVNPSTTSPEDQQLMELMDEMLLGQQAPKPVKPQTASPAQSGTSGSRFEDELFAPTNSSTDMHPRALLRQLQIHFDKRVPKDEVQEQFYGLIQQGLDPMQAFEQLRSL